MREQGSPFLPFLILTVFSTELYIATFTNGRVYIAHCLYLELDYSLLRHLFLLAFCQEGNSRGGEQTVTSSLMGTGEVLLLLPLPFSAEAVIYIFKE
jgi:hypothetical protein